MRRWVCLAAISLIVGATTAFAAGRCDPPYDETARIAELAKHQPSRAVPSDIQLPLVATARAVPRLHPIRDAWGKAVEPPVSAARDSVDIGLSPTALSLNGSEVLRLHEGGHGVWTLPSPTASGGSIGSLTTALDFESKVVAATGGTLRYANLFVDESTSYEVVLALVRAIDLQMRFVVRTRSTGLGYVSFRLGARSRNEFAPPIELDGSDVRIADTAVPSVDGNVDQAGIEAFLARTPRPEFVEDMSLLVRGAPRFVDLVGALAIVDSLSSGEEPQWTVCGSEPRCVRNFYVGDPRGLERGQVGRVDNISSHLRGW